MRGFQKCRCLSAVIRALLIIGCLLTSVTGDEAGSEDKIDIKYALIGLGIGLFLVAGFIIVKLCIIRRQVRENSPGISATRSPHGAGSSVTQC